jgi:hypothetical protein
MEKELQARRWLQPLMFEVLIGARRSADVPPIKAVSEVGPAAIGASVMLLGQLLLLWLTSATLMGWEVLRGRREFFRQA